MSPTDFLRAVWPATGYYCIARPTPYGGFQHLVFETIEEAASHVTKYKNEYDIYFCMHTLKEPRVWNPKKVNKKTGELGAYEVRVQTNTKECRCFFFDLDVEPDNAAKYASQEEAAVAIRKFCQATRLPKPVISSSGGGLHVFWLLENALSTPLWRIEAAKLRALARHHGLKADPSRQVDSSSVLRVPGTYNFKHGADNKRLVKLIVDEPTVKTAAEFTEILDAAITQGNVAITPVLTHEPKPADDLGDNLSLYKDKPQPTLITLLKVCKQLRQNTDNQETLPEPAWFHTLNCVRFCKDADEAIHTVSERHPKYSRDETIAKVAHQAASGSGPSLCARIAEVCGAEGCVGCPYKDKVKSPLVAAMQLQTFAEPIKVINAEGVEEQIEIPNPPEPYMRHPSGGVAITLKNKDGTSYTQIICPFDFFPRRRVTEVVDAETKKDRTVWRAILPHEGYRDFPVPARIMYDQSQLLGFLAERGLNIDPNNAQIMRQYMIAYVQHLQRLEASEKQITHFGWAPDFSFFASSDKAICTDGTVKTLSLSPSAQAVGQFMCKAGTLEKQIELMEFYNNDAYIPNQFFILAALAAPFFYATGQKGATVCATGNPGASKSSSLYTGSSFWGHPSMYPLNGTNNGATAKARQEWITVLSNLPCCADELTHVLAKEANSMVMSSSQGRERSRLSKRGTMKTVTLNPKSTLLLITSNKSLHSILATDNAAAAAGSMRLFELNFHAVGVHTKPQADRFLRELERNYGHIGEEFLKWAIPRFEEVEDRIIDRMDEIDTIGKVEPSERFWSAAAACTTVIAEIAHDLKLVPYSPKKILSWVLESQLDVMRGVVKEEYSSPLSMLSDFICKVSGDIAVVKKAAQGNSPSHMLLHTPRGEMVGHYDVDNEILYVNKQSFSFYCRRQIGATSTKVIKDIKTYQSTSGAKIILNEDVKKCLGSDTHLVKPQTRCIAINMSHPEMCGAVALQVLDNPDAIKTPAKGGLKLVSD